MPYTDWRGFKGRGLAHTQRILDLLNIVYAEECKRSSMQINCVSKNQNSSVLETMLVDVSQSHQRITKSSVRGDCPCLTTSSELYSFKLDRVLLPQEHLYLQGWSRNVRLPRSFAREDVRRLAGEGIALPCLGLVVSALMISKGFPA